MTEKLTNFSYRTIFDRHPKRSPRQRNLTEWNEFLKTPKRCRVCSFVVNNNGRLQRQQKKANLKQSFIIRMAIHKHLQSAEWRKWHENDEGMWTLIFNHITNGENVYSPTDGRFHPFENSNSDKRATVHFDRSRFPKKKQPFKYFRVVFADQENPRRKNTLLVIPGRDDSDVKSKQKEYSFYWRFHSRWEESIVKWKWFSVWKWMIKLSCDGFSNG
jgi:hypothetical protein